ncbi:hypothetical protein PtA15_1A965 [Puccinia triticina]|uniref:Uncharacterized protein n=1 Tax=Puccinia triticina TaxID=208348 RepID=A0ABY7C8Y1_9BASI|nr:uncharacterized protein PtA15_1A965 [Puccinia triticina]WAQ81623.1 hypothetical protein PtA15_1A965 [Puccinia triticina]WAR52511.1 hypothetical protein PtB15_1B953 [Puccinia triticina]
MDIPTGQQRPSSSTKNTYSDSEIAKLLLLESQTYTGSDNSILTGKALKTNKRFLKSVIRNVNDHNRLLERRSESSLTPTRTVNEQERRKSGREDERRRRDPEPDRHSSRSRHSSSHHHHTTSGGTRDSGSRVSSRPSELSRSHTHHNSSSTDREKRRRSDSNRDLNEEDHPEEERRRVEKEKKRRTRDRDREDIPHSSHLSEGSAGRARKVEGRLYDPVNEGGGHQSPAGDVALPIGSKMDKYFAAGYDPRLDVNLDDITNPQTGIIEGGNYDDWEIILAQMKAKRDERAREKERKLELKLHAAQRKLRKSEKKEHHRSLKSRSKGKRSKDASDDELDDLDRERRRRKRNEKKKKKERRDHSASKTDQDNIDDNDREKRRRKKGKQRNSKPGSESDSSSSSSSDSHSSSTSSSSNDHCRRRHREPSGKDRYDTKSAGLIAFNGFSKLGTLREWDRGKPSPT